MQPNHTLQPSQETTAGWGQFCLGCGTLQVAVMTPYYGKTELNCDNHQPFVYRWIHTHTHTHTLGHAAQRPYGANLKDRRARKLKSVCPRRCSERREMHSMPTGIRARWRPTLIGSFRKRAGLITAQLQMNMPALRASIPETRSALQVHRSQPLARIEDRALEPAFDLELDLFISVITGEGDGAISHMRWSAHHPW